MNFSALEIRLRRICATLASSVNSGGQSAGSSKISSTASFCCNGFITPRSAPNNSLMVK